jgi:hypothetical protein
MAGDQRGGRRPIPVRLPPDINAQRWRAAPSARWNRTTASPRRLTSGCAQAVAGCSPPSAGPNDLGIPIEAPVGSRVRLGLTGTEGSPTALRATSVTARDTSATSATLGDASDCADDSARRNRLLPARHLL